MLRAALFAVATYPIALIAAPLGVEARPELFATVHFAVAIPVWLAVVRRARGNTAC
jgi:hypothetical protein